MARSGGMFRIDEVGKLLAKGDYVVTTLHFQAKARGKDLSMSGIEDDRIREVWLFSDDQDVEDSFWGGQWFDGGFLPSRIELKAATA